MLTTQRLSGTPLPRFGYNRGIVSGFDSAGETDASYRGTGPALSAPDRD